MIILNFFRNKWFLMSKVSQSTQGDYLKQQLKCVGRAHSTCIAWCEWWYVRTAPMLPVTPLQFWTWIQWAPCTGMPWCSVCMCAPLSGSSEPVWPGNVMVGVFFVCVFLLFLFVLFFILCLFFLGKFRFCLKRGFNLTNVICLKVQTRLQAKLLYCDEILMAFYFNSSCGTGKWFPVYRRLFFGNVYDTVFSR